MTDDRPITLSVLAKFHREVILPDIERVVGDAAGGLRDEMHTLFDALAQRLDRLETEYHMLVAGVRRVEERLDVVEKRLEALTKAHEKYALRSDLEDLKARVEALQEQIRAIEDRLEG